MRGGQLLFTAAITAKTQDFTATTAAVGAIMMGTLNRVRTHFPLTHPENRYRSRQYAPCTIATAVVIPKYY